MSEIKDGLLYTSDDEWVLVDGDSATVGVTDYAQDSLSDIVYLELPSEGDSFDAGDTFGVVESVKAASDLYMPMGGEIVEVNEALEDTPELVNSDPYGDGWMIKFKPSDKSQWDELLTGDDYAVTADEE